MEDFGAKIGQFRSFIERELLDRFSVFDVAGIIVVHAVDVGPYLDFIALNSRADQRSGCVAAASFQIVDFSKSIAADIPLCNKKPAAGVFGKLCFQVGFNIFRIWFTLFIEAHKIKRRQQNGLDLAFLQIELQETAGDQLSLGQNRALLVRGKHIQGKTADVFKV